MKTQEKEILNYLQSGYTLTPLEALKKFGCLRLSGRIYDLKKSGYDIKTKMIKENGKWIGQYSYPKTTGIPNLI